jgi:hypothetical protein
MANVSAHFFRYIFFLFAKNELAGIYAVYPAILRRKKCILGVL